MRLLLSFSSDPERQRGQADEIGARAGTPAEAAAFGDVVNLAVPWPAIDDAVQEAAGRTGAERVAKILAGDDADAKAMVAGLIEDAGFDPVDVGTAADAARTGRPIPPTPAY